MELKLVYRFLRKLSDWTLDGFYSEFQVQGTEHVPRSAPLILASTHPNELLDVAALAITVPYGTQVSFWARSTSFEHPFAGPFLRSSGALPVKRNPNTIAGGSDSSFSNSELFKSTMEAMLRGEAVGSFPEGACYTEPGIVQVLNGAAWAGVEYAMQHDSGPSPVVIPVSILHTDKAQYQSRMSVTYHRPIYVEEHVARHPENVKEAVKEISAKIEAEWREHTINAPDWDTLYAAETARSILYGDETNIYMEHWQRVSQRLVDLFRPRDKDSPGKLEAKDALRKYKALQSYTNLSDVSLTSALPSTYLTLPSRTRLFLKAIRHTLVASLNPLTLAFLPVLPIFSPAYFLGWLGCKLFATPGEPEGEATVKGLAGGAGLTFGLTASWSLLWKYVLTAYLEKVRSPAQRAVICMAGAYLFTRVVWTWHKALVRDNYTRLTTALAAIRLLIASTTSSPLLATELQPYLRPPKPVSNPYIRRQKEKKQPGFVSEAETQTPAPKPSITMRSRLIKHHLVPARRKAIEALRKFLDEEQVDVRVLEGYMPGKARH